MLQLFTLYFIVVFLSAKARTAAPPSSKDFPIEEFVEGQMLSEPYMNLCGIYYNSERCCDCAEDCMKYGTCCIDKLWNKQGNLNDYLQRFIAKRRQYNKTLSCQKLLPKTLENLQTDTYYMVASCLPDGKKSNNSSQCKNINNLANMIPVLGDDGYIYRNTFCAECNNVDKFSHIKLEFKCTNNVNIKEKQSVNLVDIQTLNECIIKTASEFKRSMKVCTHRNEECQPGNENYDLCQAYSGPLINGAYRNYHCWKCLHGNATNQNIFRSTNCPPKPECTPYCILPEGKEYSKYIYAFTLNVDQTSNVIIQNYQQQFPIREFLNISNDYKFPLDKGLDQYLCTSPVREKCCSCYDNCIKSSDCCIDVFWNKTNPPESLDSYVNIVRNNIRTYYRGRSCEYVYPYPRQNQKGKTYLMVKSCPNNVDREIDKKCRIVSFSNLSKNIPVYDENKVLYANYYCARCNSVANYTYASIKLTCDDFSRDSRIKTNATELAKELRKSACTYSLVANSNEFVLEECVRTSRDNYCAPSSENYELCNSYFGEINRFPNYHCLKCNNNSRSTHIDLDTLRYCDPEIVTTTKQGVYNKGTWSMLITPKKIYIEYERGGSWKLQCSENQILDPDHSICVAKDDGKVLKNTIERRITSIKIKNATFERCVLARGSKLYIIIKSNKYSNMFKEQLINEFQKMVFENATFNIITNNSLYNINNIKESVTILELNELMTLELLANLNKAMNTLRSSVLNSTLNYIITLASIPVHTSLYSFQPERYFPRGRICHRYELLNNNTNVAFDNNCNVVMGVENETISNDNISMWIDVRQSTKGIARCEQFHLTKPCLYTKLLYSENVTLDSTSYNITMQIDENQTIIYAPEDYQPTAEGYVVCTTTSNAIKYRTFSVNPHLLTLSRIEEKISFVGTCLSIVCYICIISTYMIFVDLRTLPGYSYTFMCLYLLLADCLFIASVNVPLNTKICTSLAVLLHWSLLGSFMWSIVIAFDLVSKFTSFSMNSPKDCIKQIKRRFLLTFTVITVYITILIALDQSSAVDIHYGTPICWINNVYARLGFYIIPTALISVFTFGALVYTIMKISKEQKDNESVLKTQKKSNLLRIALKLAVILGVTELIGYVNTGASNPKQDEEIFNATFRFTYSVLRSLRGVMLWIVLILGADIMKRYKKQYEKTVQKSEGHTETNSTNKCREHRNHTSRV